MRLPRLILEPDACAYHCIARTIDKKWYFDTPERRDRIVKIIRAASALYGVQLINFCVMSNHIHLLVSIVSETSREPLNKEKLMKISSALYRDDYLRDLKDEFARAEKVDKKTGDTWHTQQVIDRYEHRRGSLSNFMQEVQKRIGDYINKEHKRKGVLWDGRFKSPVVENTLKALSELSAYIDLNPIRAGIVDKPEDYRWCGYAAALGGNKLAQKGLASLYSHRGGRPTSSPSWRSISSAYRQLLYEKGIELLEDPNSGMKGRLGFTAEQVDEEISRNGKLSKGEVLLHRVRYFTDGAVIGSARFVESTFQTHRSKLTSPSSVRKTGARPMRGADWDGMVTLRDLRLNALGRAG